MRLGLILIFLAVVPLPAFADGAFPDSTQILLPADRPHDIIVGTNFGLLLSHDDGATWTWVCEQAIAPCARLYQLTPVPDDTIVAVSTPGVVRTTADGCQSAISEGIPDGSLWRDAFADPNDASHILVSVQPLIDAGESPSSVYESHDGGRTFPEMPLYVAPMGTLVTGVEVPRGAATTIYLTRFAYPPMPVAPTVLRSTDGGAHFMEFDQTATLGAVRVRLALVDPQNPQKLFLRVTDPDSGTDSLAISEDGGATSHIVLPLPSGYFMTAVLRRDNGTVLVTGLLPKDPNAACSGVKWAADPPFAQQSTDGGHTFTPWMGAPHARGLGERAGALYAVADNFADGYTVGVSTDGTHFRSLLRFDHIGGIAACPSLQVTCAQPWSDLMTMFGIGEGNPMQPDSSGCGCSIGGRGDAGWWWIVLVALAYSGLRKLMQRSTTA